MADDEPASAPMPPPPPPEVEDVPTDDDTAPTATSLERRATAAFRKGRLSRARDLYTAALELERGRVEVARAAEPALAEGRGRPALERRRCRRRIVVRRGIICIWRRRRRHWC